MDVEQGGMLESAQPTISIYITYVETLRERKLTLRERIRLTQRKKQEEANLQEKKKQIVHNRKIVTEKSRPF
jgi:hypothetical protein